MKVRYCMTPLQRLLPCGAGWANYGEDKSETCQDEPMEENCHCIMDTDNLHCPYCGGKIEIEAKKKDG